MATDTTQGVTVSSRASCLDIRLVFKSGSKAGVEVILQVLTRNFKAAEQRVRKGEPFSHPAPTQAAAVSPEETQDSSQVIPTQPLLEPRPLEGSPLTPGQEHPPSSRAAFQQLAAGRPTLSEEVSPSVSRQRKPLLPCGLTASLLQCVPTPRGSCHIPGKPACLPPAPTYMWGPFAGAPRRGS